MVKVRKIAITGSTGFLGQHVLHSFMTSNALSAKDNDNDDLLYEIYALYGGSSIENFSSTVIKVVPNPQVTVTFHKLDLTCAAEVQNWVSTNTPDVCLHLAALASPAKCQENSKHAHDINCPVEFFKALANANVDVVALSTDQVYSGRKASPETEFYLETNEDKVDPVNVYGTTKVSMEKALQELLPYKSVLLRSSIILGPEAPFGGAHKTFLHFCASREGVATDYFDDECRSVIAVSDVVSILQHFAIQGTVNKETSGIYNMGGKDRTSRYDMAMAVAERFQFDKTFVMKKQKATMPPGNVPSPLDISMDSSKLAKILGRESMMGLEGIISETFPQSMEKP